MYRVLLVDDEILVLKSLEAGVNWRKSGFQVAGKAHNADQALQLAAEIKPHIVFTDIRMPGMSGLELMKKMKETDEQILFVVISGYAEFEYVKKSLHYGVLGYCLKPFDDEEIDVLLHSAAAILEENKLKRQNSLLELLDEGVTEYSQHRVDQILTEAGLTAGEFHVLVALGKGTLELEENDRWVGFKLGNDKYGFFVQFAHPQAFERLLTSRFPDCWMGVGVVTTARDMKSMTKNLELASVRAWDFFLHGRAGYFRGNDPGREAMAARLVKQLTDAVGQKKFRAGAGAPRCLATEGKQGMFNDQGCAENL
ncbi:response regulator [Cohnella ginsengisoli]|uniref:Response regulator n=1 Tax=Cohnella ginsengisoli TaxID=425004 RepID=A0A9X4KEE4_9BACL|nr:response regulator [Cohnella ginsengisoli]MDG0790074.1 response regulator [Cohnella ginsengisoli]